LADSVALDIVVFWQKICMYLS